MGILTATGHSISDDEIKNYFSIPRTDAEVASKTSELGFNADQIKTAFNTAGLQKDPANIQNWVNNKDNGYQFNNSTGVLEARTPSPQSFPDSGAPQLGSPTKWNVTPAQTVEGRINGILDPNNPIIQQARARSLESMNNRGLANSSLAVTAGDDAAYSAAIPIAGADAATFAKAAGYNADQPNQFALTNAKLASDMNIANLNANTQRYSTDVNAGTQRYSTDVNAGTQRYNTDVGAGTSRYQADTGANTSRYQADTTAKTQLATSQINSDTQKYINTMDIGQKNLALGVQTTNKTLLDTNQQAATAFNTATSEVNRVNMSTTMDAANKQITAANIWHSLQSQLNVLTAVSGLNLNTSLTFAGYAGFDDKGQWVGFDSPGAASSSTTASDGTTANPNNGPTAIKTGNGAFDFGPPR